MKTILRLIALDVFGITIIIFGFIVLFGGLSQLIALPVEELLLMIILTMGPYTLYLLYTCTIWYQVPQYITLKDKVVCYMRRQDMKESVYRYKDIEIGNTWLKVVRKPLLSKQKKYIKLDTIVAFYIVSMSSITNKVRKGTDYYFVDDKGEMIVMEHCSPLVKEEIKMIEEVIQTYTEAKCMEYNELMAYAKHIKEEHNV